MSFAQLLNRKKQSQTYKNALENSEKTRGAIPIGEVVNAYPEEITEHNTNSGGLRLSIKFKVADGDYKGRTIYHNLNVDCPNHAEVEERAWEEYHVLRKAAGQNEDAHYTTFINTVVRLNVWDHEEMNSGYTAERVNVWRPDKSNAPVIRDSSPSRNTTQRPSQPTNTRQGYNQAFDDDDIPF